MIGRRKAAATKYRNLKELAAVFAEMDKIAAPKKRKQIA